MRVLVHTVMCMYMEARAVLCAHRDMDAAAMRTALESCWVMKDFKEGKEVRWSSGSGFLAYMGFLLLPPGVRR